VRVVAESTWSWLLCADGDRRWLIVICGSVGLYECAVELSPEERTLVATDPSQIELLARAIAGSRAIYARRHLPAFLASTELADAIRAWRSSSGT